MNIIEVKKMFLSYASVRVRVFSIVCFLFFEVFTTVLLSSDNLSSNLPIVINTWKFTNATTAAWRTLTDGKHNALDALVEGCSTCEREQCDGTVGYGGSPDEEGETALDAMIMDGFNMNVGAVANLRNVKNAIGVARHVLINTRHSLLVGDQATNFAIQMGFKKENLSTAKSKEIWNKWRSKNCQPNFWENVSPDPNKFCGPYRLTEIEKCTKTKYSDCDDNLKIFGKYNHDTIGMIVIDENGRIFAGTSTNGANHKIPGRVGDSPIPGAGAYANNDYGAAAATGDGDVMMRFLPSFQAVLYLKDGLTPKEAATKSIQSIIRYYPKFFGGIIVINKAGEYSAACTGMKEFPFSVYKCNYVDAQVEYVNCINVD